MKPTKQNINKLLIQAMSRFGKEQKLSVYKKIYSSDWSLHEFYYVYDCPEWKYIFTSICAEYMTNVICRTISNYCRKYNMDEYTLQKEMLTAIHKTMNKFTCGISSFIACKLPKKEYSSIREVMYTIVSNNLYEYYHLHNIINWLFWWEASYNTPREEWHKLSEYTQPKLYNYFDKKPLINQ